MLGFGNRDVQGREDLALRNTFSPEFRNRLDARIAFDPHVEARYYTLLHGALQVFDGGIAVDVEKSDGSRSLLVPCIRDADTLDFGALDNVTPTAMIVYRHVDGTNGNDLPVSFHDSGFGAAANGAGYEVQFPNDVIRIS